LTTNLTLPAMVRWTASGSNGPVNDAIYRHYLPKSLLVRSRPNLIGSLFDYLNVRMFWWYVSRFEDLLQVA
jgi:hypothetical protein